MPHVAWTPLLLRTLRIIALVYVGFAALAWFLSDWLTYQPHPASYGPEGVLRIPVGRDTIAATWLPNPRARYTLLFSHGNAEDIGDNAAFFRELNRAGFSVFAYDFRGYGLSTGRPSERRIYRDEAAAYAYLTHTLGVPPERIIVHGRSLGGGPAVDLASREPVAGLVLESAFTSVLAVSPGVRIFPFDRFRNDRKMRRVRCPVLVMHGTADEVIPFAQGQRLLSLAPRGSRHVWVEGAGHNDLTLVAGARYVAALREYAEMLKAAGHPQR